MINKIVEDLSNIRIDFIESEKQIHDEVKRIFDSEGYDYKHEYLLGKGSRVDFYLSEYSVALEVKKNKPNKANVLNQLTKYLLFDEVDKIILLSERNVVLPDYINGKEVIVLSMNRMWF